MVHIVNRHLWARLLIMQWSDTDVVATESPLVLDHCSQIHLTTTLITYSKPSLHTANSCVGLKICSIFCLYDIFTVTVIGKAARLDTCSYRYIGHDLAWSTASKSVSTSHLIVRPVGCFELRLIWRALIYSSSSLRSVFEPRLLRLWAQRSSTELSLIPRLKRPSFGRVMCLFLLLKQSVHRYHTKIPDNNTEAQ